MATLKSIRISGYKKLKDIRLTELARINFLVGKNSSGKSSILECMRLIDDILRAVANVAIDAPGFNSYALTSDLTIDLALDNGHTFKMEVESGVNISDDGHFLPAKEPLEINGKRVASGDPRRNFFLQRETGTQLKCLYVSSYVDRNEQPRDLIVPSTLNFSFQAIDEASERDVVAFLNEYYPMSPDEEVTELSRAVNRSMSIMLTIADKTTNQMLRKVPFAQLSAGLRALTIFYFGISKIIKDNPTNNSNSLVICIDEPEFGFHPEFQKKIPYILQMFTEKIPNLMFFVATHSPFIISTAASLTSANSQSKTYLLSDGSVVNLALDPGATNAERGYSSVNCLNVIAQMLGAGLSDLSALPKTSEKIKIIYCEGSAKNLKDSDLYTAIFDSRELLFISCASAQEVINAHNIANSATKFVFGIDTEAYALIDRSCSAHDIPYGPAKNQVIPKTGPGHLTFTDEERQALIASDASGGLRVLKRKEIENYIFDPSIVELLPPDLKKRIRFSGNPSDIDYENGEVKDRVSADDFIKLALAELINEHRSDKASVIYGELVYCLFKPEESYVPIAVDDASGEDQMYDDAIRTVREAGKASTSLLQRKLRIGYGRAARLIERLEEEGIIDKADGSKPRRVLTY